MIVKWIEKNTPEGLTFELIGSTATFLKHSNPIVIVLNMFLFNHLYHMDYAFINLKVIIIGVNILIHTEISGWLLQSFCLVGVDINYLMVNIYYLMVNILKCSKFALSKFCQNTESYISHQGSLSSIKTLCKDILINIGRYIYKDCVFTNICILVLINHW